MREPKRAPTTDPDVVETDPVETDPVFGAPELVSDAPAVSRADPPPAVPDLDGAPVANFDEAVAINAEDPDTEPIKLSDETLKEHNPDAPQTGTPGAEGEEVAAASSSGRAMRTSMAVRIVAHLALERAQAALTVQDIEDAARRRQGTAACCEPAAKDEGCGTEATAGGGGGCA